MVKKLFNIFNQLKNTVSKSNDHKSLTDFLSNNQVFINISQNIHKKQQEYQDKINNLKKNNNNK